MKQILGRWLPAAVASAVLVLLPLAGQVMAVPVKGANCYQAECHTLGAAFAAPVGKGVQNVLLTKLISPATGIFQRNSATAAPHALGTAEWNTELRCMGCHTDIQNGLNKSQLNRSQHPIYSVTGTSPNQNHIRCDDCHLTAVTADNYHVREGGADDNLAHLRASGVALCNLCHDGSVEVGTVGAAFRLQVNPVVYHGQDGTTKYDTAKWTTCSDFGDATPYSSGCHNAHYHQANDGLVGILDYNTTNQDNAGLCANCHPTQDGDAIAYNNKHDYDKTDYATSGECDVCHSFAIASSDRYLTAGYHTDNTQPLNNRDLAAGNTMTATDAFCLQCHDGSYPVTQAFTGWQNGAAGRGVGQAANVNVNGNGTNWGYNVNGHGLDSGSTFTRAAWKTVGAPATGNPSPVDKLAAQFTNTRTCYTCHDPHATTNQYIIKTTINGNAVIADGTGNDSGVCTACHNSTTNIDSTGATPATSLFQGLNKVNYDASAHATAGLLSCYGDYDGTHTRSGCHDPHGTGTGSTPWKAMAVAGEEEGGCTGTGMTGTLTGCHGATAAGSTWNKTATAGEFSFTSSHSVTANGAGGIEIECSNCHNPHIATVANPVVDPDAITTVAADAASPGAPVPNFDKFTDFCLDCHDGAAAPAGYGVSGPVTARSHWGPGNAYAPAENPSFATQCWHCHDSHGSQNIHLVGNTRNTNPGVAAGVDPSQIGNRAVYNVYDTTWAPAAAGTNNLVYNGTNQLDPTAAGNNNGSSVTDDGLCDRCHNSTRSDNATHADVFGINCVQAGCHLHNGTIGAGAYPTAFPMLAADNCFSCHSAATNNQYKTATQYLAAHGGTMATGTDHNITFTAPYNTAALNNCYKCHLLTDGTYPHKSGVAALKVGSQATVYSHVGDYKLVDAVAPTLSLAGAVQFCLYCHGDATIANSAANLTGFTSATTPQVQTENTGANYRTYGHGAGASLSGGRAGAAALECATCHQYHGGTVSQAAPRTINNTVNNAAMIDSLLVTATYYPYTIGSAQAKDDFCALTCHQASTTIDTAAYAAGVNTIDHYWNETGDLVKTQTGCPQSAAPWDDCETHPTNMAIVAGPHYKLPTNLPLATYFDSQLAGRGALPGTGNVQCTTCHDPHAGGTLPTEADKQMLRQTWSTTGTLCTECHQ